MTDNSSHLQASDIEFAREYRETVLPLCERWVCEAQRAAGSLHLPPQQQPDMPGFYSALSTRELAAAGVPVAWETLAFEVPMDCLWWHEAEATAEGMVYRFMAKRAWLHLRASQGDTDLEFLAGLAIHPDAVQSLTVLANGVRMERVDASAEEGGFTKMRFRRERTDEGTVHLEFVSPLADHVQRLHPGSRDRRFLSLAISRPAWLPVPLKTVA